MPDYLPINHRKNSYSSALALYKLKVIAIGKIPNSKKELFPVEKIK